MEWQNIKETIVQFLTDNHEGKLKMPERRLKEFIKIESQLSKEYILDPTKLLSIEKQQLISNLDIKSGAGKSIVNNIYDVLNDRPLKTRKRGIE